ncbi:hypothetical protein [Paenibacillus mucilaginosus]|uniref:hypothetical protein n=1 Tax=Paenibacillus mucilaginosus TaxID=61624 RepID=UPI003D234E44
MKWLTRVPAQLKLDQIRNLVMGTKEAHFGDCLKIISKNCAEKESVRLFKSGDLGSIKGPA